MKESNDKDNPTTTDNKKLDDIKTVSFVEEKKATTTSPDESTSIKVSKLSE